MHKQEALEELVAFTTSEDENFLCCEMSSNVTLLNSLDGTRPKRAACSEVLLPMVPDLQWFDLIFRLYDGVQAINIQ